MKIIKPSYEIMTETGTMTQDDGMVMLRKIEAIARTCYKSEGSITENSAEKMVRNLISRGHEAMLEHCSLTIKFIVDRGVSHELVRHRLMSFAQESTRYCNYSQEKFGNEITVIEPLFFTSDRYAAWKNACEFSEKQYFKLLDIGATPQEARSVLPNSLKTEIVLTANLREWRHFFKLRAAGTTGKPHPQMTEVTIPCLRQLKTLIPVIFDDIEIPAE